MERNPLGVINSGGARNSISSRKSLLPTKTSALSRMSIVGGSGLMSSAASRKSLMPPAAATADRASLGRSLGGARPSMAPSRTSTGRPSTGANAASRRSSVHQASIGTSDPRPMSDPEYRKNCIMKLITVLTSESYPYPLSMKMLTAPSNKDFINIFQFLYHRFDPSYAFQTEGIEDEIVTIVKKLKYPYQVNKSLIISCGSPHNWPKLVGLLSWMVELVEYFQLVDANKAMFLAGHQADEFDQDAANESEVFFDYLTKAYATFFQGEEEFQQLIAELEDSFKAKNEAIQTETDVLEAENAELERELAALTAVSDPLISLTQTHTQYRTDCVKFEEFIASFQAQVNLHLTTEKECKQELQQKQMQLEAAEVEKARLTNIKEKQALTPADVEKMNSTRKKQEQQMATVTQLKHDMENRVWQHEMAIEKKLAELEQSVRDYNRFADKLHLTGPSAKLGQVNFSMQVNTQASKASELLSVNPNDQIRPAIMALIEQVCASLEASQAEAITISETLKKLQELKTEKQDDLTIMETKLASLEKQYQGEKDAMSSEYKEKAGEIESLQSEVAKLRTAAASSHVEQERTLSKLKTELQDLLGKQADEKKELHELVFRTLNLITEFKAQNQEALMSLEKHAIELRA